MNDLPTPDELEAAQPLEPSAATDPDGLDVDDAPAPSEPEHDGLPTIGPVDIPPLEAVGFSQARQTIVGVAINAQNIDPDVFAATLELGGRMLAREKINGATDEQLDMIETDLAVMRAVDKFRKALKDIGERQAARAALRAPAPPAEVVQNGAPA